MMIGRHFSHTARQLCHLHFLLLHVLLEASEHHLPLAGLESVHEAGDGSLVVQVGEQHQLLVDEVGVVDGAGVLNNGIDE